MLGICLRYCKNRADAEDVLQDGFIKVFSNITNFRQEGSFEGWIKRIMVNTAIDYLNKKQRLNHQMDYDHFEETLEVENEERDDTNYADINLSHEELLSIIRSLPDGYRVVFNMYAIEGYSHRDIAEMLNISINTSKTQLFKARKLIRKKINIMLNRTTKTTML
jgi:RNA polymerase sigma-70 factor (ECF subfamily)